MTRRTYTLEEKAAALKRMLAGESPKAVAQAMDIPAATLKQWSHRSRQAVTRAVTRPKKEEFAELILDYVAAGLNSLRSQAGVLGDPTFLRSEGGQVFGVAQAHRLLGDQLARYLAAIRFDEHDAAD